MEQNGSLTCSLKIAGDYPTSLGTGKLLLLLFVVCDFD